MNKIIPLIGLSILLLSACNDSKGGNKQFETSKVTDDIIEEPKQVSFEVKPFLIENRELNNAEKFLIEKDIQENTIDLEIDRHVKLQKTINQSFFNTLDLFKIKPTVNLNRNCLITESVNFSTDYYSFIIGFEDRNSWYESYLVNYDKKGRMIDFLLITQGDYIEGFTHLESKISKDSISRTMYRANYDQEPSEEEIWKEDQFTIDNKGAFQGKNLIFSIKKEDKHISDGSIIGYWKKENSSSPIDPAYFQIKREDENGYSIKFSNEDYFVPAAESSGVLKGKYNSGKFELKIVSENPTVISYSDDGRGGHYNPITSERFVKEGLRKSLLIGQWKSTNDENNFIEFTSSFKIETNSGAEDIEAYILSNNCINGEGTASKEDDYISGLKSELCWYIISMDEKNLSLSYLGRGNTLNYQRVKH
ncbi:hypothetical protein [Eudoraea chungangensis]|uniref:hypothetical protein n=1 Tax=Eudoraea chungangensis TaxID=1481905 RepID=UPI0023EAD552|nr:hypothetical protein [Eudoraea chungangensis]